MNFSKIINTQPKPIENANLDLVHHEEMISTQETPLLITPKYNDVVLLNWIQDHLDFINKKLDQYGALLFRGFAIGSPTDFSDIVHSVSEKPLDYTERSTTRTKIEKNIYTSTEYPSHQPISLHSENAFQYQWPTKIMFYSVTPAQKGGETPIAYNETVLKNIDPTIVEEFLRKKIKYVRNYGSGLDLTWQEAFQTQECHKVEAYCQQFGIDYVWKQKDQLRTSQILPAIITHSKLGRPVWFNQAHLFHISNLEKQIREALLAAVPKDDLPRHTYFGDGTEINTRVLDHIREAYHQAEIIFPWRKNDILILDNLRLCHGRKPFEGPRKVLVAMSDPASHSTLQTLSTVPEGKNHE